MRIVGIFLVATVLLNFSGAYSESSTWVNFTIVPANYSYFNESVENLVVEDKSFNRIIWSWDNPSGENFSHNLVFLNRILVANSSDEFWEGQDLEEDTLYEISIVSVDIFSNQGPRVSDSERTNERSKKKSKKRSSPTIFDDPILDYFIEERNSVQSENVIIYLNEFSSKRDDSVNYFNLFLVIMGSVICVLILSISVLIINKKF